MLYMGEGGGPPFHFAYSNTSEQIYKWNVEIKRVLHTKRIINKELNKDSGIFFFCDPAGNYEDLEAWMPGFKQLWQRLIFLEGSRPSQYSGALVAATSRRNLIFHYFNLNLYHLMFENKP